MTSNLLSILLLFLDFINCNALLWEPRGIKEVKWFISNQCHDSNGLNGTCISLPACYPDPDFPHLSGWSEFISGDYDSCAYIMPNGSPFLGTCCSKAPAKSEDSDSTESTDKVTPANVGNDNPIKMIIPVPKPTLPPNWPPTHAPLPTHPPFHWFTRTPFPKFETTTTTFRPWWIPASEKQRIITTTTFRPWWIPVNEKQKTTTTTRPKQTSGIDTQTECGKRNNSFRVVGGQKAGYWPWVAGLLGRRGLFCGGSLLSNYHVLTAAHCVTGLNARDITVRLGDLDLTNHTDRHHLDVKVSSITINPSYNPRTNHQDLAILRLKSKVVFNSDIAPICLPSETSRNYAGTNAIVIGWGATRTRGPTSKVLMELNLRVWPVSECQTKFQANFPNQIVPSNICAGDDGVDACSGDSGGPLMKHENGIYTQIGIVSWGVGCGTFKYPGVYTRVTSYLNWIKNNLI